MWWPAIVMVCIVSVSLCPSVGLSVVQISSKLSEIVLWLLTAKLEWEVGFLVFFIISQPEVAYVSTVVSLKPSDGRFVSCPNCGGSWPPIVSSHRGRHLLGMDCIGSWIQSMQYREIVNKPVVSLRFDDKSVVLQDALRNSTAYNSIHSSFFHN